MNNRLSKTYRYILISYVEYRVYFETINDRSLILIDEIGSRTDPQEGSSLAIAIMIILPK